MYHFHLQKFSRHLLIQLKIQDANETPGVLPVRDQEKESDATIEKIPLETPGERPSEIEVSDESPNKKEVCLEDEIVVAVDQNNETNYGRFKRNREGSFSGS